MSEYLPAIEGILKGRDVVYFQKGSKDGHRDQIRQKGKKKGCLIKAAPSPIQMTRLTRNHKFIDHHFILGSKTVDVHAIGHS